MSPHPTTYAVTVQGHLDLHWADWLDGIVLTHQPDGTSTLVASLADQAALHGLLARLRDLGVTLIAVLPAPDPAAPVLPAPEPAAPPHHRLSSTEKE